MTPFKRGAAGARGPFALSTFAACCYQFVSILLETAVEGHDGPHIRRDVFSDRRKTVLERWSGTAGREWHHIIRPHYGLENFLECRQSRWASVAAGGKLGPTIEDATHATRFNVFGFCAKDSRQQGIESDADCFAQCRILWSHVRMQKRIRLDVIRPVTLRRWRSGDINDVLEYD